MRVLVLGSAAGGGFPQWNCNCDNCKGLRQGTLRARPRTQSSIAVSADGTNWVLINASPDVLAQIAAHPELHANQSIRDTAIRAIILVDSQIDHTVGLLMLREGRPLEVYCTAAVKDDLSDRNPIFVVLQNYCTVRWHPVPLAPASPFVIPELDGIRFHAVPVPGKAPPFSPHRAQPHPGDNIGLMIEAADGRAVFYAPGLARIDNTVAACLARADFLLIDGTFWTDDEMIRRGVGIKRAHEMGHLALAGPGGMLEALSRRRARTI